MTFKALIAGAFASVAVIGAAAAADLPSYKAPPPPPPPMFSWEGWHIGINGAYGGGVANSSSTIYSFAPGAAVAFWTPNSIGTSGYLVGYQSGYTWQFANGLVAGYESEFAYADIRASNSNNFFGGGVNNRIEWFGTERLRFGYAFGRILPYITGGLAYGRIRAQGNDFLGGFIFPSNTSAWQAGWTVGAGVEYAVLDHWSVKAEYLFARMKGLSGASVGVPFAYRIYDGNNLDTHIARVGVNYNVKSIGALFGFDNLGL